MKTDHVRPATSEQQDNARQDLIDLVFLDLRQTSLGPVPSAANGFVVTSLGERVAPAAPASRPPHSVR